MSGLRIVIMAGGTGGHVFPALAVARELREMGHEVSWLGTQRGLESDVVPQAGFEIDYIRITGLRGNGMVGWLLAPWRLTMALLQARAILRCRRPAVVMGLGGFVTGPGGVAAWLSGCPLVIHEQNAIAGLTNRLLSYFADTVLEAFPDTFKQAQFTGNPVRRDIMQVATPEQRYAAHQGPIRLFVLGGSLGALVFNQTLPKALALMPIAQRPVVRHQTGKKHLDSTRENYAAAGVEAELLPFIDNMAEMYEWADLVLCRSGALTVSELAVAGVPAVLVPFPYAVDDHQTANGRYLADEGAARLIQQTELNEKSLAEVLSEYCADPQQGREVLQGMAERAGKLARPEATRDVVNACLDVAIEEQAA